MGELIRELNTIKFSKGVSLLIELNEGSSSGSEDVIHIQNERCRLALKKSDFIQLMTLIMSAKDNLMSYKKVLKCV